MTTFEMGAATTKDGFTATTGYGRKEGVCVQCGVKMGAFLGTTTDEGPIHNECVANYRRAKVERCGHCDQPLLEKRVLLQTKKYHPECVDDHKAGRAWEPPAMTGCLSKLACGRSKWFGRKNWKERFFVINSKTGGLIYYENEEAYRTGKPPKNMAAISKASRLITKPTPFTHLGCENTSTELVVVFEEGGRELRLLVRCKDWKEKAEWNRVLACYIKDIDNPVDLKEKYSRG